MLSLKRYIWENSGVKVTRAWMEKMYAEFNETLFDNALPKCELRVTELNNRLFGRFEFQERIMMRTTLVKNPYGKYRLYHYSSGEAISDKNILKLRPLISMNSNGSFKDETAMESTLIHEMIHFYTYRKGYCPAQAHGKEFRQMCIILKGLGKKKYGKEFDLSIYGDCDQFEMSDEQKKKEQSKYERQGLNAIIIEVPNTKFPIRIVLVTNNLLNKMLDQIKNLHTRTKEINNIRISLVKEVYKYAPIDYFSTVNTSRVYNTFYLPENIPELYNPLIESNDIKVIFENGVNINEGKFKSLLKKIKEKIVNLFIDAKTNLSLEDVEKIGKIEPTKIEEC